MLTPMFKYRKSNKRFITIRPDPSRNLFNIISYQSIEALSTRNITKNKKRDDGI